MAEEAPFGRGRCAVVKDVGRCARFRCRSRSRKARETVLTACGRGALVGRVCDTAGWQAYRTAVGDRLRAARIQANLTQEDLAHRAGVSRNVVQRIERGDPEAPRLSSLWRLARELRLPPGELLAGPE